MTSLASSSRAGTGEDTPKVEILKDALYEEMLQHGSSERLYTQNDLIGLNIIPRNDLMLLLKVVQGLCDERLLVAATDNRTGICWRYRSREDAKKCVSTSPLVFAQAGKLTNLFPPVDIPLSRTTKWPWYTSSSTKPAETASGAALSRAA
jgi:hypothetical protein